MQSNSKLINQFTIYLDSWTPEQLSAWAVDYVWRHRGNVCRHLFKVPNTDRTEDRVYNVLPATVDGQRVVVQAEILLRGKRHATIPMHELTATGKTFQWLAINLLQVGKRLKAVFYPCGIADEWVGDMLRQLAQDEPTAAGQVADLLGEDSADRNTQPWHVIPESGNDRKIVELWCKGYTAPEIAGMLDDRLVPKTITNKISQLRGQYGQKVVPINADRLKMIADKQ